MNHALHSAAFDFQRYNSTYPHLNRVTLERSSKHNDREGKNHLFLVSSRNEFNYLYSNYAKIHKSQYIQLYGNRIIKAVSHKY